jgi:hypothetical protein
VPEQSRESVHIKIAAGVVEHSRFLGSQPEKHHAARISLQETALFLSLDTEDQAILLIHEPYQPLKISVSKPRQIESALHPATTMPAFPRSNNHLFRTAAEIHLASRQQGMISTRIVAIRLVIIALVIIPI